MSPLRILLAVSLSALVQAQAPIVTASAENERLQSSSVQALGGGSWRITLVVGDDNGNTSLPTSFRRWWRCRIGNLAAAGATSLQVRVTNAGYSDVILPVWARSTDGGLSFGAFERLPASAVPVVSGSTHNFSFAIPAGVTDIELAKYFPYTVTDKDAFVARVMNDPSGHVRLVDELGRSWQNRPVQRFELTDVTVPDAGKHRVWIHAGVHPSETTSYFVVEGLVDFLLSGDPRAEALLDSLIFDIVPMPNPDGVFLGNYRTNSRSVEIESQWASPYNSPEREIVALRTEIERLMGTTSAPGGNPIEVLLNLHSSHNVSYPFHFQHVANSSFNLQTSRSGVIPVVNAKEGAWIAAFRSRSPFVQRGSTMSSTVGAPTRPFVESMMHDRWSIDPLWTGSPNFQEEVMAITYEGTYGRGPDGVSWNTPDDYRHNGEEMALALADYFGLLPASSLVSYGSSCSGLTLQGFLSPGATQLTLQVTGAKPSSPAWLAVGTMRINAPILPPPSGCPLLTSPLLVVPTTTSVLGTVSQVLPLNGAGGLVDLQYVAADLSGPTPLFQSSPGLELGFAH